MTDKYEEFKKWFELQPNILQIVTSIESDGFETKAETENIFEVFEKEWCEKQKEDKIKAIILTTLQNSKVTKTNVLNFGYGVSLMCLVEEIYDELTKEGYLK